MTRLLKNEKQKFTRHCRARVRAWAMVPFFMLGASIALATSLPPEKNEYRAEKTVNDYKVDGPEAGGQKQSDFDYATIDLRSDVWVDRSSEEIYAKGDELKVGFEVNQDAYAVVYRIDTEGYVTVLWPRSRFDDGFVFGAHEYQLPVSGEQSLRVSSREGEGFIEAVVSKYPFDLRNLEIDFHHEKSGKKYSFAVAGDPFLAMNEVNYAITGLEDSGEFVVTNYAQYYVHQSVDHPRYLCSQCHLDDEVAYDPYVDDCTLTIEYDYSWYNGWYDQYGYYPVYYNPAYVYIDPWTYNPWVNYWYTPSYYSAPWYGWGWGWGACYSWGYSPYYYGNSNYAYSSGYDRYRPLNRNNSGGEYNGSRSKSREYTRGSEMVQRTGVSDRDRSSMSSRTRGGTANAQRGSGVGTKRADRGSYRGADINSRSRQNFDQIANGSSGRGGLRIRESGQSGGKRGGQLSGQSRQVSDRRHTAGGQGREAGLAPVTREPNNDFRGTNRTSGRGQSSSGVGQGSSGSSRTQSGSGDTGVTNSRNRGGDTGVTNSRNRGGTTNSSGTKSVQPRKRNTRVWNSSGSTGSSRSSGSSGSNSRSRSDVTPRRGADPKDTSRSGSSRSSGSSVKKESKSRDSSSGSSSSKRGSSRGSSKSGSKSGSKSSSKSGSRGSGSSGEKSGSGRR